MSSKRSILSRREFLARSTSTAAGVFAATAVTSVSIQKTAAAEGRVIGANDRINMAVIGIRGRGNSHAIEFAKIPNVRIKTLCDIDENLFPTRVKKIAEIQGYTPTTEYDLRRVLEDKDIDAIAIASTNHWHALNTIWACQAGMHVYVEKPCSHNIFEGRKMVEAACKYNRIVSVGFQSRSHANIRSAIKYIHDGNLGDIYMARGLCFKPRDNIGKYPDGPMAKGEEYRLTPNGRKEPTYDSDYLKGVHYDLWLGPAPKRAFNRNRFHYNWHWHWDYGNGDIGNQGVHEMDICRWGINKNEHPVKIRSFGGYFAFENSSQEVPNTQTAVYEYADGKILQFEVRGLHTNCEAGVEHVRGRANIGATFYGTKGWLHINNLGATWKTFFGRGNEPGPSSDKPDPSVDPSNLVSSGGGNHFNNFICALRSGKKEELTADIEGGHLSAALPHLANISYRLGRDLTFDGAKEKFIGDKEADRMLTRKYRKPFVVPEKV